MIWCQNIIHEHFIHLKELVKLVEKTGTSFRPCSHCESQLKDESEWRAGFRGWGGAFKFKVRGLDIK